MSGPLENVLSRLEGVSQRNGEFVARCPVPGHGKGRGDVNPSVSVTTGEDGRVLLYCHCNCPPEAITAAVGLSMADLFPGNGEGGRGEASPGGNPKTAKPLTLDDYAEAKGLTREFLESVGVGEIPNYNGQTAVRIPYFGADHEELAVRFRLALEGEYRFRWRSRSKPILYGLWRLAAAREAGYVVLVEGESDCHVLWHHGIPAIGVPGASIWRTAWAEHLEGIEKVYVMVEPDAAAESLWERIAATPALRERLYRAELDGFKDAAELHLDSPERFVERIEQALHSAISFMDIAESEAQERGREAWRACEELANETRILDRFAEDLGRCGVAGETAAGKLVYLALNSRHLDAKQLVNVVVKGPSSAGKTFLVERVLGFFPDSAYHFLTAMSERALAYSEEPLEHRFLVLAEAAGMSGEFQTYLIRSLLSEGRLRYETVEKDRDGGLKARVIEREGPTGLIVTTTRTRLHSENETRMLAVRVDDTPDHTREILAALAEEKAERPDLANWQALQTWIGYGERRVTVPFAKKLAAMIPPVAVRLRRDFGAVLNLIRSHALLHQATRERDEAGRIVATVEDYAVVRDLVADLISEGVGATVPEIVRETVKAARRLLNDASKSEPVTIKAIGTELKLDKQPAYRRVKMALDEGYLRNLEDRRGRPARLVLGDEMPNNVDILPDPEQLREEVESGFTVLGFSEDIDPPPPLLSDDEEVF
jgi:hypothetical protein